MNTQHSMELDYQGIVCIERYSSSSLCLLERIASTSVWHICNHSSQPFINPQILSDAYDKAYREAFDNLSMKDLEKTVNCDKPPTREVIDCREMFGELDLPESEIS